MIQETINQDPKLREQLYRQMAVDYGRRLIGQPYIWGGEGPGFDCSGFVQECLRSIGLDPRLDQNTTALRNYFANKNHGKILNTSTDQLRVGDLIFWPKGGVKFHVAIVSEITGIVIQILEAGGGTSKTKTSEEAQKHGAMVRQRTLLYRGQDFEFISPNYLLIEN